MFEHDPLATLLLVLTGFQTLALIAAWAILRRRASVGGAPHGPSWFTTLADRPRASILLVFGVALALSALVAAAHWPVPRIQDEFSYRLAGETFAAGRLTNPPHPLWPHFETEHVLHQPTYASKYPPMQGLSMALGIALTGEPMVGVWLGLAAACAAVCWMLYAFLPGRWALLGGFLIATHPSIIAWWGHSGWGGQMAMLGGALLYGSLKRIVDSRGSPSAAHAILMGLGLAVLANSRPYEGLVASLPAAAVMAWYFVGPLRPRLLDAALRVAAPIAAVLALTGAAMTMYSDSVTGDPTTLPYQLHTDLYGATPMFLWQDLPPPQEHPERKLRDFYDGWERSLAIGQQSAYGMSRKLLHKSLQLGGFYLGPALAVAITGLALVHRRRLAPDMRPGAADRRWMWFAASAALLTIIASLVCIWFNPHYVAPIAPLLILLAVLGLCRLWESGGRTRMVAAAAIAAHLATAAALPIAAALVYPTDDWSHARARMIADLTATGEEHLVILRHGREYSPHEEWVYNAADIDGAPVVWARELDSTSAQRLREYYKGRKHWLLQAYRPANPDKSPAPVPVLKPYPVLPAWLGAPPRVLLGGEQVLAVLVADLDHDGIAELIVAPAGRAAVLIYRAGAWDAPSEIVLPAPAVALVVEESAPEGAPLLRIGALLAGRAELAVVDTAGDRPGAPTVIGLPAPAVAAAVVPGEGAIAVSCPAPAGVALVRWDGDPMAVAWVPVGSEPHGITAADFDADGAPDLAVCDRVGSAVWMMPGQRDGGAWRAGEPMRIADVPEALGLAAADLDGDGRPELAAVSAARDELVLLRRQDDGAFAREALNTGVLPIAVASADIDGNGVADLACVTRWGHGLTVLRNRGGRTPDGAGWFEAPAEVTLGEGTWHAEKASRIAAGDLDGDGVGDIAVAANGGVWVFLSGARSE